MLRILCAYDQLDMIERASFSIDPQDSLSVVHNSIKCIFLIALKRRLISSHHFFSPIQTAH